MIPSADARSLDEEIEIASLHAALAAGPAALGLGASMARVPGLLHAPGLLPRPPFARPAADAAMSAMSAMLAQEADHRVANSLQIVASMLHQQARAAEAEAVRDALSVACARVTAIARLHVALRPPAHASAAPSQVELRDYLSGLCASLGESMGLGPCGRAILVELESCALSPLAAQRLGLLVTELVTNALRHALPPSRPGTVRVHGGAQPCGGYRLCVEDDGAGLPRGFDLRHRPSGLGLRMALMCADQLQARLSAEPHPRAGARFILDLPRSMAAS